MNLHLSINDSAEDKKFCSYIKKGLFQAARMLSWSWSRELPYTSPEGRKWVERYEAVCDLQDQGCGTAGDRD